ncbi:methionyl-tRNA formyltransferase [Altericista sp. CCNU0014]|uniref:methionyl-tRNA formyltransferase n=1 Tax=Altericista sp. CCNU0014 TaxID=3082949 RepID=UPI00384D14E9
MIKLIFWGTPQFAVPSLQRLFRDDRFEVLGVVTQPDKRRGRGNQLIPSPVKQLALECGLPVWQPTRVKKDAQTLEELRSQQADAFVVVAYGQILSPEILAMPRLGCINAHGSLLPAYRGAAPIQWSIFNGDAVTGVTTMRMDAGMDTGPMLLKRSISVGLLDDVGAVAARLAEVSADLLVETLVALDRGSMTPEPQEETLATYARLLEKTDFLMDWSRSAIALHNQARAFAPNVTVRFREQPLKVLKTVPLGLQWQDALPTDLQILTAELAQREMQAFAPGAIVFLAKGQGPVVQTGEGLLLLQSVQPAGKRQQSGWDFANGLRLQVGDRLENGTLAS